LTHIFGPTETRTATRQLQALRRQATTDGPAAATTNTSNPDDVRVAQEGLWETVKVNSVSRLVATAYAQSLLILVLTLQVHVWGAHLYHAEEAEASEHIQAAGSTTSLFSQGSTTSMAASSTLQAYQRQHQQVLQRTLGYFLQTGLTGLLARVAAVVTEVLQGWQVLDAASLETTRTAVLTALREIRSGVEESNVPAARRRSLWRFLVPPTSATSSDNEHEEDTAAGFPHTMEEMLAETWDWLESPLLAEALEATLEVTFDHVTSQCLPSDESLSLAQWLPRLKKAAGHLEATEEHPLVERIQQLPSVQEISQLCFRK
jgi:hypothetical protein